MDRDDRGLGDLGIQALVQGFGLRLRHCIGPKSPGRLCELYKNLSVCACVYLYIYI